MADYVSDEQRSQAGCIGGQNGAVTYGQALSCGLKKHQGRFVFTPVLRNSFLELMPMSLPR